MNLHHSRSRRLRLLGAGVLVSIACPGFGAVTLPSIFSEHMVLQRDGKVPVWGWAKPSEAVRVEVAGTRAETQADAGGRWRVELNLTAAPEGPHRLAVEGENRLEIGDVLVGEVWVCSGQSNMAQQMGRLQTPKAAADIAGSANPRLRMFRVATQLREAPAERCEGAWTVAGPEATKAFSAVAYYFGKTIEQRMDAPVGLVSTNVGGTPVEGWTSRDALKRDPALGAIAEEMTARYRDFSTLKKNFAADYRRWEEQYGRADRTQTDPAKFAAPEVSPEGWQTVRLSGSASVPIACGGGAVWLRKTVRLGKAKSAEGHLLELAVPVEFETAYWNGEQILAKTLDAYPGRGSRESCTIPEDRVKPGDNVLAVRIFNAAGAPAIESASRWLRIDSSPIEGDWLAKPEFSLPELGQEALADYPQGPKVLPVARRIPTFLFNAMVNPLIPYAMKGVIWYQGEDNVPRAMAYRRAFPLLIGDWRARWGRGDFPFYFCQLANFRPKTAEPADSPWAELREAQSMALSLPNTGQAVLIDIGEEGQVHYVRKDVAGERLAAIALARTYGKPAPYTGPVYSSMQREGGAIHIRFKPSPAKLTAAPLPSDYLVTSNPHCTKPLVRNSPGSPLEGFAICGEDRRWVWANARIDGESVLVEAPQVPNPVAVRYGWANNPTCNLYNSDGFPAAPFRTDDFPAVTAGASETGAPE